jgi:hypothetical protein
MLSPVQAQEWSTRMFPTCWCVLTDAARVCTLLGPAAALCAVLQHCLKEDACIEADVTGYCCCTLYLLQ